MKKKAKTLREIFTNYLQKHNNVRKNKELNKLRYIWNKLLIKEAKGNAYIYKYEDLTLYVIANGSDWASYIRMEANNLKNVIQDELGIEIRNIRVMVRFFKRFVPKQAQINIYKQLSAKEIEKIKGKIKNKKELFGYLIYEIYKKNVEEKNNG